MKNVFVSNLLTLVLHHRLHVSVTAACLYSMEIIATTKGKPCVLYGGYGYRKYREKSDGTVTWTCLKEKTKKCKGRLRSKGDMIEIVMDHQCGAPEEAQLEIKKSVFQAKKRAREEDTSVNQLYTQEMGELYNKGYDLVTEMPSPLSLKRVLYLHKNKAQGKQKEPTTREEILLDDELLKMSDGKSFLLADDGTEERIIIFSGEKGTESLKYQQHFFMDGTFKSCSIQFSQIYTIHADFGSQKDETNIYPIVFAFLPNKKMETYIRMFRLILNVIPEWRPVKVNVDFESAAISALREVFPLVEIHGCLFHMKQCMWRKVQELGLTNEYRENEEVRLHIRMCAALAFLKQEDVHDGWLEIHSQAPDDAKLSKFFDYVVDRWIENENIPISIWNCYKKRHRTTNAVEGWNNKLNSMLAKNHPRFKDVIQCLKKEAENTNCMYMRMELNLEGKKRKKMYIKLDERLDKTIRKYEETGDIRGCLVAISYIQKLD